MPGAQRIFNRFSQLLDVDLASIADGDFITYVSATTKFIHFTPGTGVKTALAVNVGSAGAVVVLNGAGGTPSGIVLTNGTGLPLTSGVTGTLPVANGGTGITSLGTGVATFLGTPTFANLNTALTGDDAAGLAASNAFTGQNTITTAGGNSLIITNNGIGASGGPALIVNQGSSNGDIIFQAQHAATPLFTIKTATTTLLNQLVLNAGTSVTTGTAGGLAFDTDAWASGRGAIQCYDGTANTYVVATLASDTPTNGQVPTWNTGGTIDWQTPASGSAFLTGKLLWVDAVNGNDSTAVSGNQGLPYLTIGAAKTAAASGDTITVRPGTYNEKDLLKNGVNYNFMPGATVQYSGSSNGAIFDDSATGANAAVVSTIGGNGSFIYSGTGAGATNPHVFYITNTSSEVYAHAQEVENNTATATNGPACVFMLGGYMSLKADEVVNSPTAGGLAYGAALWWEGGSVDFYATSITTTGKSFVALTNATFANQSAWIRALQITATNYQAFAHVGTDTTCRMIVQAQTIAGDIADVSTGFSIVTSGSFYLTAETVRIGVGGVNSAGFDLQGGESYITIKRLLVNSSSGGHFSLAGGLNHINIQSVKKTAKAEIFNASGGTSWVSASDIVNASPAGVTGKNPVTISAGTLHIFDTRFNASGITSGNAISISGGTLTLRNVDIITDGVRDSVTAGTAQTVEIHGSCWGTTPVNANVTLSPLGTYTVASATRMGTIELGAASDTTLSRASAGQLAVEGVNVIMNGGPLGTPSSGNGSALTALTAANITAGALANGMTATTQAPADNSTKLATTAYVETAVLQGPAKEAVKYASTAALPSIVYANGSSGVGATLTGVALAAISLDSSSPAVADRVLIKNQVSTFQNGIYTVTATGSGIAVFVLTRTTDFDQSSDIKTGASTLVTAGSTLASTTWDVNSADSPVMGTDAITFAQTAGPGSITGGNGITVTGASVAIDTSVTVDKTTVQTLTNKTLTSPTLTTPALGTPSSGTLTSCTGLPVSTGISGFGTGVATTLAINIGTTGAFVVKDGALGTPSSGSLASCSGLAVATGISGLGTSVATALAVNVGSDGAFVVKAGALGTPSSGVATNLTGTAASLTAGTVTTGGSITLATPQASTSGTSIDFTGIPSTAKQIVINFVAVSTNGTSNWLIQTGDSGGIETTGYISSSVNISTAAVQANSTAGFLLNGTAPTAAGTYHGSVILNLENSTNFTWVATGIMNRDAGGINVIAGSKATSAVLDRVRITTANGTDAFDAGEINISYS